MGKQPSRCGAASHCPAAPASTSRSSAAGASRSCCCCAARTKLAASGGMRGGTTRPTYCGSMLPCTLALCHCAPGVCFWLARPCEFLSCPNVPRPLLGGCFAAWFPLRAEHHPDGFDRTARNSARKPHQALLCTAERRQADGASRCKLRQHVAPVRAAGWAVGTAYPSKSMPDIVK
jgi:hypothetical protein